MSHDRCATSDWAGAPPCRLIYITGFDGHVHVGVLRGTVLMTPATCHATDLDMSTASVDLPTNGTDLCVECFPFVTIQGQAPTETLA
mgnify:FL=1